jgi:hypothetical protein
VFKSSVNKVIQVQNYGGKGKEPLQLQENQLFADKLSGTEEGSIESDVHSSREDENRRD